MNPDRPRVLFIDQTAQLGGAELCLLDLLSSRRGDDRVVLLQSGPLEFKLRELGCEVSIASLEGGASDIRKESGLLDKLRASKTVYKVARQVARLAVDKDVLYANTPKALVVAAMAGRLAKKPIVYHLHDILSLEHFSHSNLWLLVFLANRFCKQAIANSVATQQAFVAAGGKTPVRVIYNGFDASPFAAWYANRSQHRQAIRGALGIGEQPTMAVFGRLAPWKGQEVAIDAVSALPDVQLLLVGDALFGEEAYKRQLMERAARPDVAGRIHFLGFRQDVGPLMQAVDGVVHCSTAPEPFGRVIVEAMLSRRPIIASRAGGAMEILEDGKTGYLTPPGDAQALAGAIRQVLSSSGNATAMIEAAYTAAVDKFALPKIVEQVEEVLVDCLANKP